MYTNDLGFDRAGTRSGAITRYMRMCICLARLTVGSPAGMSDTTGSFQCLTAICLFDQIGQTTLCFHDLCQILSITDSQSGRIISSIFQFRQTIQQDRCCLSVSCKTNDSTHRFIPPDIYFSRLLYFPSYAKRLRVIARVVIDFTPYIPFRRSH